jgi:hypothetical protein
LVAVVLLVASGCVQNAVLELDLELPPADQVPPNGEREAPFALTQVRDGTIDFGGTVSQWKGADDPAATMLGEAPHLEKISVVTEDASLDVNIRVSFCTAEACNVFGDDHPGEVQITVEHPFYIGERTSLAIRIAPGGDVDVPTGGDDATRILRHTVGRCEIRGCVAGDDSGTYCRMTDGTHLCE